MNRNERGTGPDPRSLDILDAIVRLNIETGRAVSSGLVERYMQRRVSSATIRSVMKSLETAGFLEQPHTSAGRLPTDAGFRSFVDRLLAAWPLQRHETPPSLRRLADQGLSQGIQTGDRFKALARLLSRLTDNVSIIVGPALEPVRVVRVEFYPRSARRVLMVVVLENSEVRTGLVDLPEDTAEPVLEEAARLLSARVRGRSVGDIRKDALGTVDLVGTPASRCAAALARRGRELFRESKDVKIEFEGVGHILEEPEFHDPEPLKALIRFMESPLQIRESLDRLDCVATDEFRVWIGRENPVGELRRFSLLTGRYDLDGRPGLLAVLGPRRMSYQRAFHGMEILRRVIGESQGSLAS
ncbi:MAG: heat-inducible transcriptional repressor HrcA [Candidatus Krumholzibacteriota bacterium]